MFYADLKDKPGGRFKRLTGVRPATFLDMCAALEKHLPSGGRVPKLCLQDRLLLTLMYWREYRTQAHIAATYGVHESTVCRTVGVVERALMRSGAFRLPGKRALTRDEAGYQVVVIDATECPVERPKKAAQELQRQEEAPHTEGPGGRRREDQAGHSDGLQRGPDARLPPLQAQPDGYAAGDGVPGR